MQSSNPPKPTTAWLLLGAWNNMKQIIPTIGEKIEIEVIEYNIRTDFYLLGIKINGICCTELRMTFDAIEKIYESSKRMVEARKLK